MTIQHLLDKVHQYQPDAKDELFIRAFEFAQKAHEGQRQKSGAPYIYHCLETALLLTDSKVGETPICAALLHDVPARTTITIQQIREEFGDDIGDMVEGVQQLSKIHYHEGMTEQQVDLLRKLCIVMTKDVRVLLIKLASRLNHMRSLEHVTSSHKELLAKETKEIYVYLADLLGIWRLRWQLEDMSFQYLQPDDYQRIKDHFNALKRIRNNYIDRMRKAVLKEMKKNNIPCEINGRFKHFYSIYRKMSEKQKEFDEIYDVFALRVIVNTIPECYQVLGIIHGLFPPVPGRIKDYIAAPKMNGYQSLHTTVYGFQGHPTEFQIRTKEMHEAALYGIAAHWFYKQKGKKNISATDWINAIFHIRRQSRQDTVLYAQRLEILQDSVFVFTTTKEIVELPKNATPVDFAYAIHTSLGHRCKRAIVNNKEVPLSTKLQTGDTVFIISEEYENPQQEWLSFVVKSETKRSIMQWLKNNTEDPDVRKGRLMLQHDITRFLPPPYNVLAQKESTLLHLYPAYQYIDDFYRDLSRKKITSRSVLQKLWSEEELLYSPTKIVVRSTGSQIRYVTIRIRMRRDPRGLSKLLHVFLHMNIALEAIRKRDELSMNRIQYSFLCRMPSFDTLYTLCEQFDKNPEIESIIKE